MSITKFPSGLSVKRAKSNAKILVALGEYETITAALDSIAMKEVSLSWAQAMAMSEGQDKAEVEHELHPLDPAIKEELKEKIYSHIKRMHGTVALNEFSRLKDFKGDYNFGRSDLNILFWANMSNEAITAIEELIAEELITPFPTQPLVYLYEGSSLSLPIAKSFKKKYSEPHWFPIVLNLPNNRA